MNQRGGRARAVGALFGAGIVLASSVGSALEVWACVPLANLVTVQPRSSGPPGSEVTVEGVGFQDGAKLEVRWNGVHGPQLGTASGPNFSVPVTVPSGPEGLYAVVVLQRETGGGLGYAVSTPFQVIGVAGPPGAPSPRPTPAPGGKMAPQAPTIRHSEFSAASALLGVSLLAAGAVAGALIAPRNGGPRRRHPSQ